MLIIPYTCNCASKSTTGQFWWWLGQSHGLLDLRRKAERMRHRSETSVKSKWHRSETAVKSKGHRSDIKVNSKWNRSDIKVKSKWDQSELEVISKWNRSDIRVNGNARWTVNLVPARELVEQEHHPLHFLRKFIFWFFEKISKNINFPKKLWPDRTLALHSRFEV